MEQSSSHPVANETHQFVFPLDHIDCCFLERSSWGSVRACWWDSLYHFSRFFTLMIYPDLIFPSFPCWLHENDLSTVFYCQSLQRGSRSFIGVLCTESQFVCFVTLYSGWLLCPFLTNYHSCVDCWVLAIQSSVKNYILKLPYPCFGVPPWPIDIAWSTGPSAPCLVCLNYSCY